MKIARFFAGIFACLGMVLLLGSMGFFLWNRNAQVRILELPREAVAVSENFAQALNAGDLEAAAKLMYGQPDLGVGSLPETQEGALIWEAFCSSIAFEMADEWAVEQSTLVKTGSITTMDVHRVFAEMPQLVQSGMDQRIAAAEDLSDIYDEQNEFRAELVEAVLEEALQQALRQEDQPLTREVTMKLISRDGSWWVVPDQNLLQILTGLA